MLFFKSLKLFTATLAITAVSLQLSAQSKLLKNLPELHTALASAKPGDTLIMANGEWKDVQLVLTANGTAQKPLVISAQTPGKVFITGRSSIQIGGNYLVISGLYLRDGYAPGDAVISFKKDNQSLANHSRVTNCVIERFSQPDRFKTDSWVVFWGQHNRVDHCTFIDKLNSGPTIIGELDDERSQQNYHSIDSNYFKGRQRFGSNGGESIRIGVARYSLTPSRTHIMYNYFEHCNGEAEVISIKSGENHVSFNTFYECEGNVVLRHGSNNTIEGNLFLGNNKPFTGGIRVVNPGHKIFNNVFLGTRGEAFRSALAVINGVPNAPITRYYQVKDADIHHNTFVNCASILFGAGKDAERTLAPKDVKFRNNLFVSSEPQLFTDDNKTGGILFSANAVQNARIRQLPAGFMPVKVTHTTINGIETPLPAGQAGAAVNTLPFIKADATGASWYTAEPQKTVSGKKTLVSRTDSKNLPGIVAAAAAGDTIVLSEGGLYLMDQEIRIKQPINMMAAAGLPGRPTLVNASDNNLPAFITIDNGGSLKIKGIGFSGTYQSYGEVSSGIRTAAQPMNQHYNLLADGCEFYNLSEGFKAQKSSFADHLTFRNSIFHHILGTGIELAAEKEDKGIYNAEYVTVENCVFANMLSSAVNSYRGGNDESTLGPFIKIDHCTFNAVENREQGTVIRLIGAQQATVSNCLFANSGQGGRVIQFQEYRWDKIKVDYCDFYHTGKPVESFYGKAAGTHMYYTDPKFKDASKLNFSPGAPLLNKQSGKRLGATLIYP